MLVTEKDANSNRCLMLELIQAVHTSAAPSGPESPVGCIGSNCLWWRWLHESRRQDERPEGEGWEKTESTAGTIYWGREIVGYCGLAGEPE